LQDVLALTDGSVAIFDARAAQGPELLVLDTAGQLIRRLGRRGAGPGEYGGRANLGSLAEGPNGEIWLLDAANNRINRWTRDGRVISGVVPKIPIGPIMNIPLLRGSQNSLIVPAKVRTDPKAPFGDHLYGALRMDPDGVVLDTFRGPPPKAPTALPSVYAPRTLFHPLPDGGLVVIRTDAAIATIGPGPREGVKQVVIPIRAATFNPRERAELIALSKFQANQLKQKASPVPSVKPVLARIQLDGDGTTLWLQHPAEGKAAPEGFELSLGGGAPSLTFIEPTRFVAVRTNGTFLGEVRFESVGIRKVSFNGKTAWGIVALADGRQVLVRWRLPA